MRIRAITPIHVGAAEHDRRQRRYDRLSTPGVTVSLLDLPDDPAVPRALNTPADVRRSEELVIAEARRTNPGEYDCVLPDCVLDPGVGWAEGVPVPLVGILRLTVHLLTGLGQRFSAVARNAAIADELTARIRSYGYEDSLTQVRVLGLDVDSIPDDNAWARAILDVCADLDAGTIINGCSAVEVRAMGSGPTVIDPTAEGMRMLGVASEAGLLQARAVTTP